MAYRRLVEFGHEVVLVGRRERDIGDDTILDHWPANTKIHTVTFYIRAEFQREYYDEILRSGAQRLIFNPGAENPELAAKAKDKGIEVEEACTLVMLATGAY
jgi:predicted CoA-binding protein